MTSTKKPLLSIIFPAYNEEAIIRDSVSRLYTYMADLEDKYDWELIIVNDGSKDQTGKIADELSTQNDNLRVYHHIVNRNLGSALRTGFSKSEGDYVIVLDIDFSYSEEHIGKMLTEAENTDADVVLASPYMKGGKSIKVPFFRLLLSKVVNRIMRISADKDIHTFTSMVRVYKGEFLRNLNLKSSTYSINPEIIYKAILLRANIVEIPATLDWSFQENLGTTRTSSIRVIKGILNGLMTGFIFRPYAFFLIIGIILLLISVYVIGWIFLNTIHAMPDFQLAGADFEEVLTKSVAHVFQERPHSFFVGGTTLVIALQFLSIAFLSLQNKRYFDELFHLGTTNLKKQK